VVWPELDAGTGRVVTVVRVVKLPAVTPGTVAVVRLRSRRLPEPVETAGIGCVMSVADKHAL
jgi:hypothetical protein